jgi:ABC-type multidrug transport system fused ATPase/permease subunit
MQQMIRQHFGHHTIICVAHKLHTIIDFDEVIVLDEGRIVERGNPQELALVPSSRFAELLRVDGGGDENEGESETDVADSRTRS